MAREEGFFDDLARGLADGSITRGKALRLMGAALVGGALGSVGIGEASAVPPGCKRNGKNCTRNVQCCSGNCSGGSCRAQTTTTTTTSTSTTPGCQPNGTHCDFDQQCCGEVCNGGICCSDTLCDTHGDCCGTLLCDFGVCNTCLSPHGQCNTDDDCCTGFCTQNACEGCRSNGDNTCTLDGECCSGYCSGGTCAPCPADRIVLSNGSCVKPCGDRSDCAAGCEECVTHASDPTGTSGYCTGGGSSNTLCTTDDVCPRGEFCAGAPAVICLTTC
jgi:hypothetical protein